MAKIEIRLSKFCDAGMYEIRTLDLGISANMVLKVSSGEPFKYAYRDAERLAIMLNCELYLDDKLIRSVIE